MSLSTKILNENIVNVMPLNIIFIYKNSLKIQNSTNMDALRKKKKSSFTCLGGRCRWKRKRRGFGTFAQLQSGRRLYGAMTDKAVTGRKFALESSSDENYSRIFRIVQ